MKHVLSIAIPACCLIGCLVEELPDDEGPLDADELSASLREAGPAEPTGAGPGDEVEAPTPSYPVSDFVETYPEGRTSGTFTWYNRSVGVGGSVRDYDATAREPGTTVFFDFYQGAVPLGRLRQTRTDRPGGAATPFQFTADASGLSGGITAVCVFLCSTDGVVCSVGHCYPRP